MKDSRRTTHQLLASCSPLVTDRELPRPTRLLRLSEVMARVPLARPTIYKAIREKKFPAPVKLLNGRASAWGEEAINDWIAARLVERAGK